MASLLKPKTANATVANDGTATVSFTPPSTYKWQVGHIAVSSTSTTISSASAYVDNVFYCGTDSGNGDSADGTPLQVNDTSQISLKWQNATPGSVCTCVILVEEVLASGSF